MTTPSLQQVTFLLREIQRGRVPDLGELLSLCGASSAVTSPPLRLESYLNAANKHGDTAFLVAARYGHVPVLKTLHRGYEVPLEHSNADGKTAMHEAAQHKQAECVEYLLGEGAQVDSLKRADWCVSLVMYKLVVC